MDVSKRVKIQDHFNKLYFEWEKILYPKGRKTEPAIIKVIFGCKTSGFWVSQNLILIYITGFDIEYYEGLAGIPDIYSELRGLHVNEIELLHEMLHEMQYKELTEASVEGKELYKTNKTRFSGPGHDELFFSAVVLAAKILGHDPELLVKELL